MGKSERHFGTNDEHCTPPAIYRVLVEHWGAIGLDPCHSPASRVPAQHRVWHPSHLPLKREPMLPPDGAVYVGDGLLVSWDGYGLVYVNMPYSEIRPWVKKASEEGDQNVLLMPARTGSTYWREYVWEFANAICFLERGQVFESYGQPVVNTNPDSKSAGKPMHTPWHSVLAYWGTHCDLFEHAFSDQGKVVVL